MANRKLQGEIDRTLKQVQEGVELFDQIWKKVYSAQNANQKEKYEGDLKKQIKKLQRYRDQIKSWMTNNEIKDKRPLGDARKLIETEMERFKVCEKETKTKAYSKEGLGQMPKTDPLAKAKHDVREWILAALEQLQLQIDSFEAETETIRAKKTIKKPDQARVENLDKMTDRHKFHLRKLEQIQRLMDNDLLAPIEINDIKDGVYDYIEHNQEGEYIEDEDLYEALNLDQLVPEFDNDDDSDISNDSASMDDVSSANGAGGRSDTASNHGKNDPSHSIVVSSNLGATRTVARTSITDPLKSPPAAAAAAAVAQSPRKPTPVIPYNQRVMLPASQVTRPDAVKPVTAVPATPAVPKPTLGMDHAADTAPRTAAAAVAASLPAFQRVVPPVPRAAPGPLPPLAIQPSAVGGVPAPTPAPAPPGTTGPGSQDGSQLSPGGAVAAALGQPQPTPQPQPPIPLMHWDRAAAAGAAAGGGATGSVAPFGDPNKDAKRTSPPLTPTLGTAPTPHPMPVPPSQHPLQMAGPTPAEAAAAAGKQPQATTVAPSAPSGAGQLPTTIPTGPPQPPVQAQPPPLDYASVVAAAAAASANAASAQLAAEQQTQAKTPIVSPRGAAPSTAQSTLLSPPSQPTIPVSAASLQFQLSDASTIRQESQQGVGNIPMQAPRIPQESAAQAHTGGPEDEEDDDLNAETFGVGELIPGSLADLAAAAQELVSRQGVAEDHAFNLQMLDSSFKSVPDPSDSERPKQYVPRNPYPTPASFPQVPPAVFEDPAIFDKFDTDTLFFIFYYQQGTYQQYLAARELKKQSWRYHKKYLTWFQRHEEPKVTTDEYEQGTYVYFDYETGWCQRIKTEFTFEYGYLEDELAV